MNRINKVTSKLFYNVNISATKHRFLKIINTCCVAGVLTLAISCTPSVTDSPQSRPIPVERDATSELRQLTIAMIPSQSSEEESQQRQLLANYLQDQMGLPVNIEVPQDYDTAIELLVNGSVQMAYLGPFSYVKAQQQNPLLEPIVAPIDQRTGRPWYTSVIVADISEGIENIEDLRGRDFGFVSQSSTSGYLVPLAHLIDVEIDPDRDFGAIDYAGSHNENLVALTSGTVDAISINKPTYLRAQQEGELPEEQYQLLWESEPIPNSPIVISSQLPSQFKIDLQRALLNAPVGLAALSGARSDGYTLVEDRDYDVIRQIQATLGIEVDD